MSKGSQIALVASVLIVILLNIIPIDFRSNRRNEIYNIVTLNSISKLLEDYSKNNSGELPKSFSTIRSHVTESNDLSFRLGGDKYVDWIFVQNLKSSELDSDPYLISPRDTNGIWFVLHRSLEVSRLPNDEFIEFLLAYIQR